MSNFSSALEQALSDLGILKQDFAKTIGVGRGVVSSYTGALIPIGGKTVARVCAALPMPHKAKVLKGYLLDQMPADAKGLIRIEILAPGGSNPRELPEMDDDLSTAFRYLVERSLDENVFRSLVVDLYNATSGKKPLATSTRKIDQLDEKPEFRDMPLYGAVPAGAPADNPQMAESYIAVPIGMYPYDAYALRVSGDSMIGKDIFDGDIVIVHKREATDGDVVVAVIDGETTLKTLVHRNGKFKLQSENPKRKAPVLTDQSAIQAVMLGKFKAV